MKNLLLLTAFTVFSTASLAAQTNSTVCHLMDNRFNIVVDDSGQSVCLKYPVQETDSIIYQPAFTINKVKHLLTVSTEGKKILRMDIRPQRGGKEKAIVVGTTAVGTPIMDHYAYGAFNESYSLKCIVVGPGAHYFDGCVSK